MSRRPAIIPEDAICRAANLLIQQHGTSAEKEALRRAQAMRARGDDFGQFVWSEIRRTILGLQLSANRGAR